VVCVLLQEDTSLSKVHTMFRQLGLRHLAVIPRASSVVGVITRHDLLPEALEETFVGQQAPLGSGGLSGWVRVGELVEERLGVAFFAVRAFGRKCCIKHGHCCCVQRPLWLLHAPTASCHHHHCCCC
jgi:hypothetical protein